MVVIADLISVILGTLVMAAAWRMMLFSYSGWFAFRVTPIGYAKMFGFVLIGYLIVMVFDFQRIKKIPMDQSPSGLLVLDVAQGAGDDIPHAVDKPHLEGGRLVHRNLHRLLGDELGLGGHDGLAGGGLGQLVDKKNAMKGRSTVPPLLTESSRQVRGAQKQSRNTSRSSRWKEKDQRIQNE